MFYCQNVSGRVDFSIEEWNKTYQLVKNMSQEIQRLALDDPSPCNEQCFECMAIVGETRIKNRKK